MDKLAVYYLNDILIYLRILEEHKRYVKQVLDILYSYKLSVNKEKSEFYVQKTVFLGFKITLGEIRIEPSKVKAVRN